MRVLLVRLLAALLLAAAVTALAAARAEAGNYVVVGCSDLSGSTIRPTDGWYLFAGSYPSRDLCPSRGGLYVAGSLRTNLFRFDAPAGTTIARLVSSYRAHLSGLAPWPAPTLVVEAGHNGEWNYIPPATGHLGSTAIDVAGNRVSGDAHGADGLRIGLRCELAGPCAAGGDPWARFLALAVVLDDSRPPSVDVRAPEGHLRGSVSVAVAARDEGGGVYERTLELDGRPVARARLCDTVTASLGALRHVTQRVPCPLDAPAVLRVDTREVADGPHTLLARVEDVAGNARTAVARIAVDNLPPRAGVVSEPSALITAPPGAARSGARLTAWLARGRRRLQRATVTWPARVRIGGRLTDLRGRPLGRRSVRMLARIPGRRWRSITGVRTRRDGRLTALTGVGASREVRLEHGDAAVTLRLAVRVAVRVRIRRYGPLTVLSGGVRGGHVPRAGLRLRLQSRGFGAWRTRALLRTDGLGRFTAFGRVPAGARLRVVVPAQRGYPYARGVGRP